MAEEVECLDFRVAARQNGYAYGKDNQIFIYKSFDVAVREYGMPDFRLKSSVGAIEAFVGLLQNIGGELFNPSGHSDGKFGKNLPGVEASEGTMASSYSLSGPMYLLSADDAKKTLASINSLARKYGWITKASEGAITYRPAQQQLYSEDPITAASRTMMISSMRHSADAVKVMSGVGTDAEYAQNIINLEKDGFAQTFGDAYLAYQSNTGAGQATSWAVAGETLRVVCGNANVDSSVVGLVPTSLSVTQAAFVKDGTGFYPTRLDISLQLTNPYGRLMLTKTEA